MHAVYRIVLLVLLAPAVHAGALAAEDAPKPDTASVKGKFLVARPTLPDPYFAHTVILMLKHDATGAFGLVVNRPAGIAEVTPDAPATSDETGKTATEDAPAREPLRFPASLGGPVGRERIFVIHSEDYAAADTIRIAPHVSVTANVQILQDIADGKGPKRSLYVAGYSGWGAGQLEAEMARKSWYEAPVDPDLIFSGEDTDAVWEQALTLRLRKI
jgi:putative transcriptional regulator